jgi:hypothetical protein
MSGWQPIETAPKDGTLIRLRWEGTTVEAIGRWVRGHNLRYATSEWRDVMGNDQLTLPTHWMPLPDPPTSDPEPLHSCRQPGFDPRIHRCLGCHP